MRWEALVSCSICNGNLPQQAATISRSEIDRYARRESKNTFWNLTVGLHKSECSQTQIYSLNSSSLWRPPPDQSGFHVRAEWLLAEPNKAKQHIPFLGSSTRNKLGELLRSAQIVCLKLCWSLLGFWWVKLLGIEPFLGFVSYHLVLSFHLNACVNCCLIIRCEGLGIGWNLTVRSLSIIFRLNYSIDCSIEY